MTPEQKTFRRMLIKSVEEEMGDEKDIAIFLSGGIDSMTVLFACLELKLNVVCYTFFVKGDPSEDWKAAKLTCKNLDIPLVRVICPNDLDKIIKDVKFLAKVCDCKTKLDFEVTWPFIYIVRKIEEELATGGFCADGYFGNYFNILLQHRRQDTKEARKIFDDYRIEYVEHYKKVTQGFLETLCERQGIRVFAPYIHQKIYQFFMRMSWQEINKLKSLKLCEAKKPFLVGAFKKYFDKTVIRNKAALQCVAHIREMFKLLLKTELNYKGTKGMPHFYKALNKRYGPRRKQNTLV